VLNYIELSENQFISLYKYHRLNKYNVLQIKLSELLFQDDYADNVYKFNTVEILTGTFYFSGVYKTNFY
jgi:hypothetical protein